MGKTLKYVKDFDFSSAGKTVGLCKGGMAGKKGYADGGYVVNDQGQRLFVSRPATAPAPSPAPTPAPVAAAVMKPRTRRELKQEMRGKIQGLDRGAADYRTQRQGIKQEYRPQIQAAPRMKKGGEVKEKATGEVYPSRRAMAKHEMMETPRMQKEEIVQRTSVKAPASPLGMLRDKAKLGIEGNKNPGIKRKSVPVAPREPMIAPYKTGGVIPKSGASKIPKVMSEFKSGELHSGSKTGPVVKSRKQAVAIALSEARAAGKKK